jgi:hypothetical protein
MVFAAASALEEKSTNSIDHARRRRDQAIANTANRPQVEWISSLDVDRKGVVGRCICFGGPASVV